MAKKKLLYCASTVSHLRNFHLPYIQALAEQGYLVTACAEQQSVVPFASRFFAVPFAKQMTGIENLKNIFRIYQFLKQEQFSVISVHTTLAAAVVRAAVLLLPKKERPKVINTCHGYLFQQQDGWHKWKYLLPEKICAQVTDVLLVMNREDAALAKHYHLCKQIKPIPGMGVEFSRFDLQESKADLRQRFGMGEQEVLFVFAGEFSNRKNQQLLLGAFADAAEQMPQARLILAGQGALLEACKRQAKQLGMAERVEFPGQVTDMAALYHCCDVCVSASRIEGLPFNVMEAMYCGLPCVVSNVKGHRDLIEQGKNGYLYQTKAQLSAYLVQLYQDKELRQKLGQQGKQAAEQYRLQTALPQIMQVYKEV